MVEQPAAEQVEVGGRGDAGLGEVGGGLVDGQGQPAELFAQPRGVGQVGVGPPVLWALLQAAQRQRLEHRRHQLVAPFDPLVRVRVGPERHVLVFPRRPHHLPASDLRSVDLDDDLALEVAARIHVEVLVRRAGEAVVADDAVGDEVAGAGGDVVQLHLSQRLDLDDLCSSPPDHDLAQILGLDHAPLDYLIEEPTVLFLVLVIVMPGHGQLGVVRLLGYAPGHPHRVLGHRVELVDVSGVPAEVRRCVGDVLDDDFAIRAADALGNDVARGTLCTSRGDDAEYDAHA